MDYNEELQLGKHLLDLAKREIMKYYQTELKVEVKPDQSPLTIADKKAEEIMRRVIDEHTPSYSVIGEECGGKLGETPHQWVIDPIDGTKSFIHGVPLFGTLLALLKDGEPVMGLIGFPALNITVWAVKEQGCFIDDAPCRVSQIGDLPGATLLDGSATTMENMGLAKPWRELRSKSLLARGWGDCFGYLLVASGRAEVMVDPIVEIWDMAPMAVIIPEAGGTFTSLKGGDYLSDRSGLATNGLLHQEVVDTFAPYFNTQG
ncbi:inositol monophosphatase family protein [Fibrobacterota bacterium]